MKNEYFIILVIALCQYGSSFDILNKSAAIKNRYIVMMKKNCTEKDIHYVVGSVKEAQKNSLSGVEFESVKNFSTLVYLTSGITGFVFDGDLASVNKVLHV